MGGSIAADIALAGFLRDKALVIIDGGQPRSLSVGETSPEGVKVLEVTPGSNTARIEYEGETRMLHFGRAPIRTEPAVSTTPTLILFADSTGHHFTQGSINGTTQRFIIDTGASMVSIGRSDAERARIDFHRGRKAQVQTASGPTDVWLVRLDTVKVGDITLHGVDALVFENDLPFALLGMSFLNRTDMQQQGNRLVLRKRF
ncbi:retropepsin-like aspartic protease family protein [Rhodocyclaceae bacterium SMB388]